MEENKTIQIDETTFVGKAKDLLELIAGFASDIINEVYPMNDDSTTLDTTHISDAINTLEKMLSLIYFCKGNNYNSETVMAVDLGYDYEGIQSIKTLKEESEY